jgi:hypothetical protein
MPGVVNNSSLVQTLNIFVKMNIDNLTDNLKIIETWCKSNEIIIFYGDVTEDKVIEVSWKLTGREDLMNYLTTIKSLGSKVLIVDYEINNIDTDSESIREYMETLVDDELTEFKSSLKVIKKNQGKLPYLKVHVFKDGACYSFAQESDWFEDYFLILDACDAEIYADEDVDPLMMENLSGKLKAESIEEIVRKITSDEQFLKATSISERAKITKMFINEENRYIDYQSVIKIEQKVQKIYEKEIKPMLEKRIREQEAEIRNNILNLKTQGLKKVEIASRLNISINSVNKHYYSDNLP